MPTSGPRVLAREREGQGGPWLNWAGLFRGAWQEELGSLVDEVEWAKCRGGAAAGLRARS
jgi:hypothetical protein